MTETTCDVVVIGAGPAGYVCAIRLAQYGLDVVCVEQDELGGCCLNVGCIPSKALISAGHFRDEVKHAETMGYSVSEVSFDLSKLIAWKDGVVKRLTGGIGMLFKARKVRTVRGQARFIGAGQLEIKTADGAEKFSAKDIVIATGSEPAPIAGFEFGGPVWSSTEALSPSTIPDRLVVIGGGVIGFELGMFYAQMGSKVEVIEFLPRVLAMTDPEIGKVVERKAKKAGIRVHTGAAAQSWREKEGGLEVEIKVGEDIQTLEADTILLTVGRRPVLPAGLDTIGLKADERGFLVTDERCATSVPHVWAVGDATLGPMLAHKGSAEGLVAAASIAGKPGMAKDWKVVPAVIFTDPEIAYCGLSEAEAQDQGIEVKVGRFSFAANGRALSIGRAEGLVKVVTRADDDSLLGVHMVGPNVTDMISEAALAIESGLTAEDLALTIHPHPTLSEVIMEAAEDVHGLCVHAAN